MILRLLYQEIQSNACYYYCSCIYLEISTETQYVHYAQDGHMPSLGK